MCGQVRTETQGRTGEQRQGGCTGGRVAFQGHQHEGAGLQVRLLRLTSDAGLVCSELSQRAFGSNFFNVPWVSLPI